MAEPGDNRRNFILLDALDPLTNRLGEM